MDIPIAFPVAEYKVPEEYTLEQKQEALSIAEQELKVALTLAEDFFETQEEMDAVLQTLRQHPDQVYTKPFMKKIAAAILRVNACQQDVEWALESVADTSLTPAQVKAQVKQMVEVQRVALERQLEQRMHAERAEWMSQIRQLREELEEERRRRKAFQSKVKDFSEDVWFMMCDDFKTTQSLQTDPQVYIGRHRMMEHIRSLSIGEPKYMDPLGTRHNIIYKRAGILDSEWPTDPTEYQKMNKGDKFRQRQIKATENAKVTTFDGTEK